MQLWVSVTRNKTWTIILGTLEWQGNGDINNLDFKSKFNSVTRTFSLVTLTCSSVVKLQQFNSSLYQHLQEVITQEQLQKGARSPPSKPYTPILATRADWSPPVGDKVATEHISNMHNHRLKSVQLITLHWTHVKQRAMGTEGGSKHHILWAYTHEKQFIIMFTKAEMDGNI